jgi:accessory gene regulator protein AgrB
MKLWENIFIMIIISFILQYYVMSLIMANSYTNIRNSYGKIYISVIMALFMAITEVLMYDWMTSKISWNYYIVLSVLLIIFIFVYKKQIGIYDKDYISEMIEHHSMAILTSEEILKKSNNYKVKRLAYKIKNTQEDEIKYMKNYLHNEKY